tara:strand:- start:1577 stop:3007 length:1431 start_codon:yes stop_codon:yes gene_type:complete
MSNIKKLFSFLLHLGVNPNHIAKQNETILMNRIIIGQFFVVLVYIPFEFMIYGNVVGKSLFFYLIGSFIPLLLNYYNKVSWAKIVFMLLVNAMTFALVIQSGGILENEFIFLSNSLLGFLLFKDNKFIVFGQLALTLVLFYLSKEVSSFLPPSVKLSSLDIVSLRNITNFITFFLMWIMIYQLQKVWSENQNKLRQKNDVIETKNKEINDSILYAKRIQQAIIPHRSIVRDFFSNGFCLVVPKSELSGDFSFFHRTDEKTVWVGAADCTGHGIPGALVSVLGISTLHKALVDQNLDTPNQVLDFASNEIESSLNRFSNSIIKDGMDISLCKLQKLNDRYLLQWSGANNPLWIIPPDITQMKLPDDHYTLFEYEGVSLITLNPNRQPIGVFSKREPFTLIELEIPKGSRLFAFSDGYADQFGGERNKKMTKGKFRKLIMSLQSEPIDQFESILYKYISDWSKGFEQVDDILIIGMEL